MGQNQCSSIVSSDGRNDYVYLAGTKFGNLCCPPIDDSKYVANGGGYPVCSMTTDTIAGEVVPVRRCSFYISGSGFIVPANLTSLRVEVTGASDKNRLKSGALVYNNKFKVTPGDIYQVLVNEGLTVDTDYNDQNAYIGSGGYTAIGKFPNGTPDDYVYQANDPAADNRLVVAGGAGGGTSALPGGNADEDAASGIAKTGTSSTSSGAYSSDCTKSGTDGDGNDCALSGGGGVIGGGAGTATGATPGGGAGGTSRVPPGWTRQLADVNANPGVIFSWTDPGDFSCRILYSIEQLYETTTQTDGSTVVATLPSTTVKTVSKIKTKTKSTSTRTKTISTTKVVRPTASAAKKAVYKMTFPASCCPAKSSLAKRGDEISFLEDRDLDDDLALRSYVADDPAAATWQSVTETDMGGYQTENYWDVHSTTTTFTFTSTTSDPLLTVTSTPVVSRTTTLKSTVTSTPRRRTTTKVVHKTSTAKTVVPPVKTIAAYEQKKCYSKKGNKKRAAAAVESIRKKEPGHKILVDCGKSGSYTI